MRMMLLPLLLSYASVATLAHAQDSAPKSDPAKAALIEEMMSLTKPEATMQQTLTQFKSSFSQGMEKSFNDDAARHHMDPAKYQEEIHQFEDKIFNVFLDRMSWTKLKPRFAAMYDETFSKQELSDIVAFYKTPSGQSSIQKLPTLMAKGSQIGQAEMLTALPEIQQMTKDFMQSLVNKGAEKK